MLSVDSKPSAGYHVLNFLSAIPYVPVDVFIVDVFIVSLLVLRCLWCAESPFENLFQSFLDVNYVRDASKNIFLVVVLGAELVFSLLSALSN